MTIEGDNQGELPLPGETPPEAATDAPVTAPADEAELRAAAQTELSQLKEAARFVTSERAVQVLEALFFAAEKPLDLPALEETTQFAKEVIFAAITELQKRFASGSGVVLVDLGGRWQLRTDPQVGAYVRRMLQVKPMRLTRAALETLAIVAYRQPITRPEIEDLRGVDCGAVTKALLERKLIRILGKKDEPGRPLLYGTSKEFLDLFNLRDLTQLPTLREFQELSEESRKIVEDEVKPPPPVAGLTEMAHDPVIAERIAKATVESDAALEQLESAIARADETTKTAATVFEPPKPPDSAEPPKQQDSAGPPKPEESAT